MDLVAYQSLYIVHQFLFVQIQSNLEKKCWIDTKIFLNQKNFIFFVTELRFFPFFPLGIFFKVQFRCYSTQTSLYSLKLKSFACFLRCLADTFMLNKEKSLNFQHTLAPCLIRACTVAKPIPPVPPVTIATLSFISMI